MQVADKTKTWWLVSNNKSNKRSLQLHLLIYRTKYTLISLLKLNIDIGENQQRKKRENWSLLVCLLFGEKESSEERLFFFIGGTQICYWTLGSWHIYEWKRILK